MNNSKTLDPILESEEKLSILNISELIKKYTEYINDKKINQNFIEKYLVMFTRVVNKHNDNEDNEDNEDIRKIFAKETFVNYKKRELREALYRLILKIKDEDIELFKKYSIENVEIYFDDLKLKYEIQKSPLFLKKQRIVKKWIQLFKTKMYTQEQYQILLKAIAKNLTYTSDYIMFDFVIYIAKSLRRYIKIEETKPRYSYDFFLRNLYCENVIMLGDLFALEGFVFFKEYEKNFIISFERLVELSYDTNIENSDLKKYELNPNKVYIYYAMSKNPSLSIDVKKYIYDQMKNINYLYPYSKDISTVVSLVSNNIYVHITKDIINAVDTVDTVDTNNYLFEEGYEFQLIEKISSKIQDKKSRSIFEYIDTANYFTRALAKTIQRLQQHKIDLLNSKDFIHYILYVLIALDNDSRLKYYIKYYFTSIINKLKAGFFNLDDYELKLFIKYLQYLSSYFMIQFYLINYISDNDSAKKIIFDMYKRYKSILIDDITLDVYCKLRETIYPNKNLIFIEHRIVRLGYKLSVMDSNYKKEWQTYCEELRKKDYEYIEMMEKRKYLFDSIKDANEHLELLKKAEKFIDFYLNPPSRSKDEKRYKDYEEKFQDILVDLEIFRAKGVLSSNENN